MPKIGNWGTTAAVIVVGLMMAPQMASAQVKTSTAAVKAQVQTVVQAVKAKKQPRKADESVKTCVMYGRSGLTARPAVTHVTKADHARTRAERRLLITAQRGNGDEIAFYQALTGEAGNVPGHQRYRVADHLGKKKGCLLGAP